MSVAAGPEALYEERAILYTGGQHRDRVCRFRLLAPRTYAPGAGQPAEEWPLVVFLHGAGERGEDNRAQLRYLPSYLAQVENLAKHPAFVLAPQCPAGGKWSPFSWEDKEERLFSAEPTHEARALLLAIDQLLVELPIDPLRVYLTGLSMGGYGCWDLAARYPRKWAAIVPICGGGDPKRASAIKALPVWAFHGARDPVVPVQGSRAMIEAIRRAGGRPKYTEFPDVGHDSWTPAYHHPDLLPWMFAQRRTAPPVG